MNSTEPGKQEDLSMNEKEKVFKTMSSAGAADLTLGVIILVTGIAAGIMMIINGARLLRRKRSLMI